MTDGINSKRNLLTLKGRERGMALILTLAMLFMLLLLAISFATTAKMWRKAAGNSNDLGVARMLAESAIQRAMGAMRFYSTISSTQFYDVRTHLGKSDTSIIGELAANRERSDSLSRLATTNSDIEYIWPANYDPAAPNAVHWQFIYNGLSGTDKRIIGRIAYLTVPGGGKLDPAACVDTGTSPRINENGANEERNGRDVKEINIKNLDPSPASSSEDYLPASIVSKFSSKNASPAGTLTDTPAMTVARWIDWAELFSSSKLNITNKTQKERFKNWFTIDNILDSESFWVDLNSNGVIDTNESYHRFNLTRTDWNSLTINDILANPVSYSKTPSTNDGNGIRWLNNCTNLPPGTFADATTRAKQIAANLKDYCDTDSIPTRDSDTNPTYTGNELTPYINEIGVKVECTATVDKQGKKKHVNTYDFEITVYCEIANIYTGMVPIPNFNQGTTTFEILEGAVYYTWQNSDGSKDTGSTSLATGPETLTNEVGTSNYRMTSLLPTIIDDAGGDKTSKNNDAILSDVKVQIKRARLMYNGAFADFVKPDYSGGFSATIPLLVKQPGNIEGESTGTCCFSYQANDPRQNLNDDDWGQASAELGVTYGKTAGTVGTPDAINDGVSFATDGDMEATMTPTTLSTAYIRNGPMKSPWELGRIHRGAKWETLNLCTYNETDGHFGVSSTAGLGTYASGDANILDQVKMGNAVSVYGKVSVNSGYERVLRALLAKIKVGVPLPNKGSDGILGNADDNSPGSTNVSDGTELAYATNVANLASAIANSASRPFKTRAQVVKVAKLWNGTEAAQTTDATKEEIIGKFINLTKAAAPEDTIVIIAMAQAIKDIGGAVIINKDINGNNKIDNTIVSESATGIDFNKNGIKTDSFYESISCQYGVYDEFADEILAEQKVMAIVYRNPVTGKWKVMKYKYLED